PIDQTLVDQQTEAAKQMIEDCKAYGKTVDYQKIEGIVAYGSVRESMAVNLPKKYAIDLIMVGQSGLNAVERFMTGSVSSYVIRRAPCDVLIVSDEVENNTDN
ncbi:MAG: universal stress protein, partial [Enterococcus hirae]|nr:universal stress protein [Enterococcus hirae]